MQKIKSFRAAHGITYPLVSDEEGVIITKFGFSGIPQDVVIGKDGKYTSAPDSVEGLDKDLKKLLK